MEEKESTPAPPAQENWWQFMQRTRRELEAAAGGRFPGEEEVAAHLRRLRDEERPSGDEPGPEDGPATRPPSPDAAAGGRGALGRPKETDDGRR